MSSLIKYGTKVLDVVNKLLPKRSQVIIIGYPNTESGAIEVANYIYQNHKLPVLFVVYSDIDDNPRELLAPGVALVNRKSKSDINYLWKLMRSRYIFFTHGTFLSKFSKKQKVVNLWHGILYKKVGTLVGQPPLFANLTVGTSTLTKKMFSKAFGVPEESVTITGYPRNDTLLRAKESKQKIFRTNLSDFEQYDKVILWLPTYRKSVYGDVRQDGKEIGNPFYIKDFDTLKFNKLLKETNTLCLIKPHPMAPKYVGLEDLSNLLFIDDCWIARKKATLYQLLGTTDVLISDVSSVVIDYLLMDKPIVCISTDLTEYQNTRGFYFSNIRDWLPGVVENQDDFFKAIEQLLRFEVDPNQQKRSQLKNQFFDFQDDLSTKRLCDQVFYS